MVTKRLATMTNITIVPYFPGVACLPWLKQICRSIRGKEGEKYVSSSKCNNVFHIFHVFNVLHDCLA